MKTKPKGLIFLSLFLFSVAASLPIQVMILYGNTPFEANAILSKLAPLNWLVMVLASVTAFLAYRASTWLIVAAPALIGVVLHNNWLVAEAGTDYSPLAAGVSSGFFLLSMGLILAKDTRDVILNPERRWWLIPTRKHVTLEAQIDSGSRHFETMTYDISETGAFLRLSTVAGGKVGHRDDAERLLTEFPVGSKFALSVILQNLRSIHCRAEVVRMTPACGKYPDGIGIKFLHLKSRDRKLLHNYLGGREG